jgi:hypothetical protein
MDEHETQGLDRRRFLAGAAAATVGGALVSGVPAGASETAPAALQRRRPRDGTDPADLEIS